MKEMWRDVAGYDGRYSISNVGRVRSNARTATLHGDAVRQVRERILSLSRHSARHGTDRKARGENSGAAKLTEKTVRRIRQGTLSSRRLAADLGVDHKTVLSAKQGRTWSHVR